MELSHFNRLKRDVASKATAAQILDLEDVVRVVVARQFADVALARRSVSVVTAGACPRCGSFDVVRYGKDKNARQRFHCRDCRRTFNILTGTPMARARKPGIWGRYLDCMTDFMSVRKIVLTGIDISHLTVFRWRHRFLAAAVNDNAAMLSGVIEGDETFFVRSFKGHRGWTRGLPPESRAARPRAWGATKRGVSSEQVPVLTVLDTNGGVYSRVLGGMGEIDAALAGRIAPGSGPVHRRGAGIPAGCYGGWRGTPPHQCADDHAVCHQGGPGAYQAAQDGSLGSWPGQRPPWTTQGAHQPALSRRRDPVSRQLRRVASRDDAGRVYWEGIAGPGACINRRMNIRQYITLVEAETKSEPDMDYQAFKRKWRDYIRNAGGRVPSRASYWDLRNEISVPFHIVYRGIRVPAKWLDALVAGQSHLGMFWSLQWAVAEFFSHERGNHYDERFPDLKHGEGTVKIIMKATVALGDIDLDACVASASCSSEEEITLRPNGTVRLDAVRVDGVKIDHHAVGQSFLA